MALFKEWWRRSGAGELPDQDAQFEDIWLGELGMMSFRLVFRPIRP
jgi:hypothetical protein